MKIFYMILAAIAAMTLSVQAQEEQSSTLFVGDFENPTEIYDGSYFDMAPTNFYLAHTGSQLIYTADELADLDGKENVKITGIAFKFYSETFEEIIRNAKLYLEATDATEFAVVDGVKQFFPFEGAVAELALDLDMLEMYGEDCEVEFEIAEPFALESGKNLLVTVVFDAEDDDNCTSGSDYAPFYTSGIRGKGMTYTNNWTSFDDYALSENFPDATATLGCGTNVELPVTRINYRYEDTSSGIEEIEAQTAKDGAYYNLMGQKFSADNLPAGIYIHNGQKIIIK